MKYLIIIIISFIAISCQTNLDKSKNEQTDSIINDSVFPKVNDEFTLFLDNFNKTELPIEIKGCKISADKLKQFDGEKFRKYSSEYLAYCQLPTNGTYIATITFATADCYVPILTTYRLNGQIIDRKGINIGGCGSDCGFSCEEFMILRKDFTFYTSDTISTFTCDSLGNETPGTYEYYVVYKEGKLLTDGRIEMSKEVEKQLQGKKNVP